MDVKVQSVHFKADQKLIDFCEKRLSKLDLFFEGVIGSEVILKLEKDEDQENKVAEIKLSVPANEYDKVVYRTLLIAIQKIRLQELSNDGVDKRF